MSNLCLKGMFNLDMSTLEVLLMKVLRSGEP